MKKEVLKLKNSIFENDELYYFIYPDTSKNHYVAKVKDSQKFLNYMSSKHYEFNNQINPKLEIYKRNIPKYNSKHEIFPNLKYNIADKVYYILKNNDVIDYKTIKIEINSFRKEFLANFFNDIYTELMSQLNSNFYRDANLYKFNIANLSKYFVLDVNIFNLGLTNFSYYFDSEVKLKEPIIFEISQTYFNYFSIKEINHLILDNIYQYFIDKLDYITNKKIISSYKHINYLKKRNKKYYLNYNYSFIKSKEILDNQNDIENVISFNQMYEYIKDYKLTLNKKKKEIKVLGPKSDQGFMEFYLNEQELKSFIFNYNLAIFENHKLDEKKYIILNFPYQIQEKTVKNNFDNNLNNELKQITKILNKDKKFIIHATTGLSVNNFLNNDQKYQHLESLYQNNILSIKQREYLNIEMKTLSPIGDIASGIDKSVPASLVNYNKHDIRIFISRNYQIQDDYYSELKNILRLFDNYNELNYQDKINNLVKLNKINKEFSFNKKFFSIYNSFHSDIYFVLKPEILLRNDIFFSDRDFGAGYERFSQYNDYALTIGHNDIYSPITHKSKIKHIKKDLIHKRLFSKKNTLRLTNEIWFNSCILINDIEAVLIAQNYDFYSKVFTELNKKYNKDIKF